MHDTHHPPDEPAAAATTCRVVVIEDHPTYQRALSKVIDRIDGFELLGILDGPVGLDELLDQGVDLLISDVRLQGLSGIDVCAAVTRTHPEVRVVFLTGMPSETLIAHAAAAGAVGMIAKGTSGGELVRLLRSAAAGHTTYDAATAAMRRTPQ